MILICDLQKHTLVNAPSPCCGRSSHFVRDEDSNFQPCLSRHPVRQNEKQRVLREMAPRTQARPWRRKSCNSGACVCALRNASSITRTSMLATLKTIRLRPCTDVVLPAPLDDSKVCKGTQLTQLDQVVDGQIVRQNPGGEGKTGKLAVRLECTVSRNETKHDRTHRNSAGPRPSVQT